MTFEVGAEIAGRYRITRMLGAGGMGEVYAARDATLDTDVALKTMRPELERSSVAIERFRREIALARRVTDPRVCRVYDVGEHAGRVFLTMELLDGHPLAGPLSIAELDRVARELVRGLAVLHAAGIVHRDFKTANVMCAGERIVIMDFGLARSDDQEAGLTVDGGLLGTPAYMAPEQVEGRPATPASDVYALGVVLFELATGKRPFDEATAMATATARLTSDPPKPSTLRAELPARWDAIVGRCLARDPGERPAIADVLDDRPRRWAPLTRRSMFAAGGLAAAAIGLGAWRLLRADGNARGLPPKALVAVVPIEGDGPGVGDPFRLALSIDIHDALGSAGLPMLSFDGGGMHEGVLGTATLLLRDGDPAMAAFAIADVAALVRMHITERPDRAGRLGVSVAITRRGGEPKTLQLAKRIEEATLLVDDIARTITSELGWRDPRTPIDAVTFAPATYQHYGAALGSIFALRDATPEDALKPLADLAAAEPKLVRAATRHAGRLVADGQQQEGAVVVEAMDRALKIVDGVLAGDPDQALAHAVRGAALMAKWQWLDAERATRRGYELAPTLNRVVWQHAYLLHLRGAFDESIPLWEELARCNPLDPVGGAAGLALMYLQSRRFADVIRVSKPLSGKLPEDQNQQVLSQLAVAHAELAQIDDAIAIADELLAAERANPYWISHAVIVYVLAGRMEQARALRERVGDEAGAWMGAMMDDAIGDIEPALAAIERTVESHNLHALYIRIDRFSPAIRAHPRFQAQAKRVGLS